jgi:PPIC-type PPIASE domain
MVLALATSCGGAKPAPEATPVTAAPAPTGSAVVSWDILQREPVANEAEVRHILIGWRELADNYGGQLDPRAAARSEADAEGEVAAAVAKLRGGADFGELMAALSEDQASATSGRSFSVSPDAQLVIEFKQLALRLEPGELGVCKSTYGFHIMLRDR